MKKLSLLAIGAAIAGQMAQTIAHPVDMFPNYQKEFVDYKKGGFNTGRRIKYARGPMSLFKQKMQHKKYASKK